MYNKIMNKEKWLLLFEEIGLDESTITMWHKKFETRYPNEHQSFLEWLKMSKDEISLIRAQ